MDRNETVRQMEEVGTGIRQWGIYASRHRSNLERIMTRICHVMYRRDLWSGITKNLKIQLRIRIQGRNHNTSSSSDSFVVDAFQFQLFSKCYRRRSESATKSRASSRCRTPWSLPRSSARRSRGRSRRRRWLSWRLLINISLRDCTVRFAGFKCKICLQKEHNLITQYLSAPYSTGRSIWSDSWVGLTLIWSVPPSTWFCLGW